ncbi:hypothetical protein OFEAOIEE_LOCUS3179 [Methylorubrum extorquens]
MLALVLDDAEMNNIPVAKPKVNACPHLVRERGSAPMLQSVMGGKRALVIVTGADVMG